MIFKYSKNRIEIIFQRKDKGTKREIMETGIKAYRKLIEKHYASSKKDVKVVK